MNLIGVKVTINRIQRFKKLMFVEESNTLLCLLDTINGGEFSNHRENVVFYFGHNDDYDLAKMHETPKECTVSELLRGTDSRVFLNVKIDCQDAEITESLVSNAFAQLKSAQTKMILPEKDKYKHTGMNNLWNWIIECYLTPIAARFRYDQRDEMNDFMRKMHEILWFEI